MPNLYLFIPWETEKAARFWEKATLSEMERDWREHHKSRPIRKFRHVSMIFYNGKGRRRLKNIGDDDALYIVGHCNPDSQCLYATESGAHPLLATEVCRRVEVSGLRQSYSGNIKIFGCSSGNDGGSDGFSFAGRFASLIAHDGYKDCLVIGYLEDLWGLYAHTRPGGRKHKIVVDEAGNMIGRARDYRVAYRGDKEVALQ